LTEIPLKARPAHIVTLHGGYETLSLPDLLAVTSDLASVDHFTYSASKNLTSFPERFRVERSFTRISNALPSSTVGSRTRSELDIPEDAVVAILIARAIHGKGWDVAQAAVERVREASRQNVHLVMIGDGPIYDSLRDQTLPEWLHLLGFQADVRSWIAIADVALLPTTFIGESFPLVLIDYLSMGVPTIASSAGEIPNMLTSELGTAGYIAQMHDGRLSADEFAELLSRFVQLDDSERSRMRLRARRASKEFDFDTMVNAYERVYHEVAAHKVASPD